jgi:hypothetical protein
MINAMSARQFLFRAFLYSNALALLLLLGAGKLHAGGAAMTFRQSWTVQWATPEDSLQFQRFITEGETAATNDVASGCSARHCAACLARPHEGAYELLFEDCPAHVAEPDHQCASYGEWGFYGLGNQWAVDPKEVAKQCSFHRCLHCRAKALDQPTASRTICSHHDGRTAHYCHGVTVTTTQHDWLGGLQPIGPNNFVGPQHAYELTAASAEHPQVIAIRPMALIKYAYSQQKASVPVGNNLRVPAMAVSQGEFMAQFVGAEKMPLYITVNTSDGQHIMTLRSDADHQVFDLRNFPQGQYRIHAYDTDGQAWDGMLDLQTGNPAHISLPVGY